MDDFARFPAGERRLFFEEAAARMGMSAQIIEKDFWVCWTLKRLFSLEEFQNHLTFKGGTSLSKVYGAIERFSEDIDVSIERDFLGFGGEMEPEAAQSRKEQQRRIDRLAAACRVTIANRLVPELRESIAARLDPQQDWNLETDRDDPDGQTLLFAFPGSVAGALSQYFSPIVKVELGARSDHFPVEDADITPYVQQAIPQSLADGTTRVRVLLAERTYWEKVTILHSLHHYPENKRLATRLSRHYYDVFRLSQTPILDRALQSIDLLERVAVHKSVFFKTGWAKYLTAKSGTLRLLPSQGILQDLRRDYEDMQPMFFGDAPSFDEILAYLPGLQDRVNTLAE